MPLQNVVYTGRRWSKVISFSFKLFGDLKLIAATTTQFEHLLLIFWSRTACAVLWTSFSRQQIQFIARLFESVIILQKSSRVGIMCGIKVLGKPEMRMFAPFYHLVFVY